MDETTKKEIDSMSYETMLALWRFADSGHHMFYGETGEYFSKVMKEKATALSDSEKVAISKRVGWK